jgi:hypothetical protein
MSHGRRSPHQRTDRCADVDSELVEALDFTLTIPHAAAMEPDAWEPSKSDPACQAHKLAVTACAVLRSAHDYDQPDVAGSGRQTGDANKLQALAIEGDALL